jgi:hypothetical protein
LGIFSLFYEDEGTVLRIGLIFGNHVPEDDSKFSGSGGNGGVLSFAVSDSLEERRPSKDAQKRNQF